MGGEYHIVNSTQSLEAMIELVNRKFDQAPHYTRYDIHDKEKVRTLTQNKAIHMFCAMIAEALNGAGMEQHITSKALNTEIEIPWSLYSVKQIIWHKVQLVQTGKESTTELNTKEVGLIAQIVERHLASMGVNVAFPSKENK